MAANAKTGKKRGATPKTEKQKSVSGWIWLATGLLIGLFVAFLIFLRGQPTPQDKSIPGSELKLEQKESQQDRAFDYDFYKLLPKLEVVVPKPENPGQQTRPQQKQKIAAPGIYVLQAGSFRKHEDADRRKASLALLGIVSKIVTVKVDGDQTWHRVQIGPFDDLAQLNSARDLLIENNVETLLLKVKG